MGYEMTIGLETHIELLTKTKIFCSCPSVYGEKANKYCCPTCLGLPGALPKLNSKAVKLAVIAGLALNCKINVMSSMYRKNYVYPDLPKAYQITQGPVPICESGYLELSDKKIRIKRIHIEEDAGKLTYKDNECFVDYNRAGVPLIEIVTEADFTTSEQVKEYLEQIRILMRFLEISDCKMQEGSLRCDVNVSLKESGKNQLGEKCEIKNVNSIANICKAIESEFLRQRSILESGKKVVSATLKYDEKADKTIVMRIKETESDYRYFPEPDLPPVRISDEYIETIKASLPELPQERKKRFLNQYKISNEEAEKIYAVRRAGDYFESLTELTGNAKISADVITSCIYRYFKDDDEKYIFSVPIKIDEIAKVINYGISGEIPKQSLKRIIFDMLSNQKNFSDLYTVEQFKLLSFDETVCLAKKVIQENPKIVDDYKNGKNKALSALIGIARKESHGKADIKLLTEIFNKIIQ